MAFGPSKAKLSQLERCLTANPLAVFSLPVGKISSFRPLVRSFFPHNFLTKYPYKHMVAPDPWVAACLARHHSCCHSGFMMLDGCALSVRSAAHRLRWWAQGSKEHGYHWCALIHHHGLFILSYSFWWPCGPLDFRRIFRRLHATLRMRKIRGDPLRRRRIKTQAVGSGARVNDPWKDPSVRIGDIRVFDKSTPDGHCTLL